VYITGIIYNTIVPFFNSFLYKELIIQCVLVAGFSISITLFCFPLFLRKIDFIK
jgi:hypothetical protein